MIHLTAERGLNLLDLQEFDRRPILELQATIMQGEAEFGSMRASFPASAFSISTTCKATWGTFLTRLDPPTALAGGESLSRRLPAGRPPTRPAEFGQCLLHFFFGRLAAQAVFELFDHPFPLSFLFASHDRSFAMSEDCGSSLCCSGIVTSLPTCASLRKDATLAHC